MLIHICTPIPGEGETELWWAKGETDKPVWLDQQGPGFSEAISKRSKVENDRGGHPTSPSGLHGNTNTWACSPVYTIYTTKRKWKYRRREDNGSVLKRKRRGKKDALDLTAQGQGRRSGKLRKSRVPLYYKDWRLRRESLGLSRLWDPGSDSFF